MSHVWNKIVSSPRQGYGIGFAIIMIKPMTVLRYFKLLSHQRQLKLIMDRGVFLMSYQQYNIVIRLFQIDNYYAEIYSLDGDGKIIMINGFDDTKYLDPYLDSVNISMLLEN
jgi:hypothetical protein